MEIQIIKANKTGVSRIYFFYEDLIQKMKDHPYRPKYG